MDVFNLESELKNIMFKMTKENKALVSALHNTDRIDGKAKESLGEFVHEAISLNQDLIKKCNLFELGTYPEIVDGKGEILNLFSRNPEAPAKFRDVNLSYHDRAKVAEVTRNLKGDWVLSSNGKKVRDFHFEEDAIAANQWLTGIILYQQLASRFKNVGQDVLLDVKARGKLLKTGDFVEIDFYMFSLANPTSGKAVRCSIVLNFTNGTYAGGISESMDLEEDKAKSQDLSEEMDEELGIDDYDDYER